jgi:hypothetical protein
MGFNLFKTQLASAAGETIVRTYHCSKLSPALALFGLRVNGYVVVTNRRLVYFAEGSSGFGAVGNNRLYNEVPLAEVTNINMSQGTRFSLLRLFGGLLSASIIIECVGVLLGLIWDQVGHANPYFLRTFILLQLAVAAYSVARVCQIERESFGRILLSAFTLGLIAWGGQVPSMPSVISSGRLLALGSGMRLELLTPAYPIGLLCLAFLAAGHLLWCLYWFVRSQYFQMIVVSKSNQAPSITIAGYSIFGRQILNVSAHMASNLSPSIDAQALFKELGAVISDIQTTGDLGIQKWTQVETPQGSDAVHQAEAAHASRRKQAWVLCASVLMVAVFIIAESIWYADMSAKRQVALNVHEGVNQAKKSIVSLSAAQRMVPKHFDAAESENRIGQQMFDTRQFAEAQTHWRLATTNYATIPPLILPLERAHELQRQFEEAIHEVWPTEYGPTLSSKLDEYSQLEWSQIKVITNKAENFQLAEQGQESCNEWMKVPELITPALRQLKVGISMERAEQEYKNKNWAKAIEFTETVLKITPDHSRAVQLRDKARENLTTSRSE